jgi:hypothetical protein
MLVVVLVALSGCGGAGGTAFTSTRAVGADHPAPTPAPVAHRHKALPEQAWEGMPCRGSAEITYGGCGRGAVVVPSRR